MFWLPEFMSLNHPLVFQVCSFVLFTFGSLPSHLICVPLRSACQSCLPFSLSLAMAVAANIDHRRCSRYSVGVCVINVTIVPLQGHCFEHTPQGSGLAWCAACHEHESAGLLCLAQWCVWGSVVARDTNNCRCSFPCCSRWKLGRSVWRYGVARGRSSQLVRSVWWCTAATYSPKAFQGAARRSERLADCWTDYPSGLHVPKRLNIGHRVAIFSGSQAPLRVILYIFQNIDRMGTDTRCGIAHFKLYLDSQEVRPLSTLWTSSLFQKGHEQLRRRNIFNGSTMNLVRGLCLRLQLIS